MLTNIEQEVLKAQAASYIEMAPRFCDGPRVIAWIDNPDRARAVNAFTESFERQIAYRFELMLAAQENADMYEFIRTLNPRQFADLYQRNLSGEGTFDDIVRVAMNTCRLTKATDL